MNPSNMLKIFTLNKDVGKILMMKKKKSFNVFIINKTLSFNPNYLNIV
jgi:hypothetical protein